MKNSTITSKYKKTFLHFSICANIGITAYKRKRGTKNQYIRTKEVFKIPLITYTKLRSFMCTVCLNKQYNNPIRLQIKKGITVLFILFTKKIFVEYLSL